MGLFDPESPCNRYRSNHIMEWYVTVPPPEAPWRLHADRLDYGESHYIGPIRGAQPNSESWVNGFPHEAWLHLNSYYCCAFKTGTYPTIAKDTIFMWARPHPRDAQASEDAVPKPRHWTLVGIEVPDVGSELTVSKCQDWGLFLDCDIRAWACKRGTICWGTNKEVPGL